jgi:hypothetical protein
LLLKRSSGVELAMVFGFGVAPFAIGCKLPESAKAG